MTFHQYRLLPPEVQLRYVLHEGGTWPNAQRWEGEFQGVNLYFCDNGNRGFFVEVDIDEVRECIVVLRCFGSSVPLEGVVIHGKNP